MNIKAILIFAIISLTLNNKLLSQEIDDISTKKISFLKKIALLFDISQRKNKKYLKMFEKTGQLIYLERYLKSPDSKQQQHVQNPLTYYMILGITEEEKGNIQNHSCLYYNVAYYIDNLWLTTNRDIDLINKFEKLDQKYKQLNIHQEANYHIWLLKKITKCNAYYENQIEKKK
ncbi:MAG: hypothetical protein ACPG5B_14150 [Chitinophagales bacterium]